MIGQTVSHCRILEKLAVVHIVHIVLLDTAEHVREKTQFLQRWRQQRFFSCAMCGNKLWRERTSSRNQKLGT